MSVSAIGGQSAMAMQQLVDMRAQFDDLQRQLSTGQKSTTYAGLGLDRGVTVSLNAQLSALSGFDNTISNVIDPHQPDEHRARPHDRTSAARCKRRWCRPIRTSDSSGDQCGAADGAILARCNSRPAQHPGRRPLFVLRSATDQPAVETIDHILNGDGAQAGLKQLISERTQADLGADGLGRLVINAADRDLGSRRRRSAVAVRLKLASVTSTLTDATVTGPTGFPASLGRFLRRCPMPATRLTLRFNLPDGTSENLTLTATTKSPPGANQFTIGATPARHGGEFAGRATTARQHAGRHLADGCFGGRRVERLLQRRRHNPPQRVDGPPFDTATGMTAGTTANTVIWYTGEAGSDSGARDRDRAGRSVIVVSYGARANEDGIRNLVQNIATLAAVTVSSSDPNATDMSLRSISG